MKKISACGTWVLNSLITLDEPYENAILNGHQLYCPICKNPMKMCIEGCRIQHMICEKCGFSMINSQKYEMLSRDEKDKAEEYLWKLLEITYE